MTNHQSDCATHNAPAYPPGKCDCGAKKSAVKKRSVYLNGRYTSVSLENEFWEALAEIAEGRDLSVNEIIGDIERTGWGGNLSSSIRLFILREVQGRYA